MSWKDNVKKVEPYVPGEQPKENDIIKLNTNENPYPPAPGVMKALTELGGCGADTLRKYPDPNASVLVDKIADYHGFTSENVFVGVGSDDVLATAFLTFFNSKKPILFPDITYSFYKVWANVYDIPYETKPLDNEFHINPEDYKCENGGIVIANPNAPTGIELSLDKIEDIIKENLNSVVIIDEAYIDFGEETAVELTRKYDNVLVVRTFSKSRSLAGLRVGYAIGSKEIISAMLDVKFSINSYTMNAPTLAVAGESIKDEEYFVKTVDKIKKTREEYSRKLSELGFKILKSSTNFIFAKHVKKSGKEIFEELKKNRIYVRHFNTPRISEYLRITIGTDEEMKKLVSSLEKIVI